ncbi:DUF4430 domain-containing protein [Parablautia muri]|uniref:DUF4430 domain-containing protein n=1 Tax=Parablautia muri TaxID=2320879 RepID=A0A9X5BJ12_9FIRM|nr:DUF4430 domain-containing protein [Parablautia muri]NBJ94850.1 DUF4430 domain-containing protein [Parablautia muri]
MKVNWNKKWGLFILYTVLIMSIAMTATGCNGMGKAGGEDAAADEGQTVWEDGSVLGEGSKQFALTVTDQEGVETKFEIHTDQETVGEALVEIGLISGDESEYGLYVKTVNGVTADYDKDGVYWAFYINGEYATAGVDATAIEEGNSYSFKME